MPLRLSFRCLSPLLAAALGLAPGASARHPAVKKLSSEPHRRLVAEKSGRVTTRSGLRLRLVSDIGSVHIHTQPGTQVEYRVRIETDASKGISREQAKQFNVVLHNTAEGVFLRGEMPEENWARAVWVTFDVSVPQDYSLDVSTRAGDIDAPNIHGRVTLATSAGAITASNIAGAGHLETGGGHITVKDVSGELVAETGGGHITAGKIAGGATVKTGGGHIRLASVGGLARIETGGGNISVGHTGGELVVETAGGQIQVGEASGAIRARTGGGGIRVASLTAPTELHTDAGSIYLARVENAVRALTGAGAITAWFTPGAKNAKPCDLESSEGDIVVYLPRHLPVTIDALVRRGDEHRIFVDQAFALKVSYSDGAYGARMVRAVGALNGGGEVLRLRTDAGNIHLMPSDAASAMQTFQQQLEQLQRQLDRLEQSDEPGKDGNQ
jgi:Putative adhesin